jgi:hypothetical protein
VYIQLERGVKEEEEEEEEEKSKMGGREGEGGREKGRKE